jgi:hypothetical protein
MNNIKENRSLENDIKFGTDKEKTDIEWLKEYWSDEEDIRNTKDIYNDEYFPYDFESKSGTSWEMKSRRVMLNTYKDTIVPVHKIRKTDKTQFFVFNFVDACAYIEYDKKLFDTFTIKDVITYRTGCKNVPVPHYHIPIDKLTVMLRHNLYKLDEKQNVKKKIEIKEGVCSPFLLNKVKILNT